MCSSPAASFIPPLVFSSRTLPSGLLFFAPTLVVCCEAVRCQINTIIKVIFPLPVQDEVFEFPGVAAGHRDLDSRAITLVTGSSRKISVRLQRATTSQATQTEPVWSEAGWGDSGSHTFPKMKSKFHDKATKDKGFAKWENEKPRVQAGVDVVDRGTAFELDQEEADMGETRQDGEVSAGQTTNKIRRGRMKGIKMNIIMSSQGSLEVLKAEWLGIETYYF